MKLKTALIISAGLLLAGTSYWFFVTREVNAAKIKVSDKDIAEAKDFDPFA